MNEPWWTWSGSDDASGRLGMASDREDDWPDEDYERQGER